MATIVKPVHAASVGVLSAKAQWRVPVRYILLAGTVGMYLAAINPWWNTADDSSMYLTLAESLARGDGYRLYGEFSVSVPPAFPLITAALMWLGLGDMLYLNAVMTIMALVMLALVFQLLRQLNPQSEILDLSVAVGSAQESPSRQLTIPLRYDLTVMVTLAFAVNYELFELATRQYSDIPFMLLAYGGLWAYLRGLWGRPRLLWLGTVALAACCWFRVVGLPLAFAAAVGLWLEPRTISRRKVAIHSILLGAAVVGTAVTYYLCHRYAVRRPIPQETYTLDFDRFHVYDRSLVQWFCQPWVNLWQTAPQLLRVFTGQYNVPAAVGTLFVWIPVFFGSFVFLRRRQYLQLLVTFGYLGAILLMRPLKARYLLPVAPMLLLYFAEGVRMLLQRRGIRPVAACLTVLGLLTVFVVVGIYKDGKYIMRRQNNSFQAASRKTLLETAAALRKFHHEGEWFTTKCGWNLAYTSGVPYRSLYGKFGNYSQPSPEEILSLLDEYNVRLVVDSLRIEPIPFCEVMLDAVKRSPKFRLVFENKDYRIYQRRAD